MRKRSESASLHAIKVNIAVDIAEGDNGEVHNRDSPAVTWTEVVAKKRRPKRVF